MNYICRVLDYMAWFWFMEWPILVYIINRIIHVRLEIWNLSSRVHIRYLTRSISMWTLEDKFHISARPCIILYLLLWWWWWWWWWLLLLKGRCWQILLVSLYDGGPEISWKSMQKICHEKKKDVMISVGHRRKIQVKLVKIDPLIDNIIIIIIIITLIIIMMMITTKK